MTIDLNIDCESAKSSMYNGVVMSVEIEGAIIKDVLSQIPINSAIGHYGTNEILDKIGIEKAKYYFDLVER